MKEKQMKTLGGYEIVDEKAREEINIVAEKADEALSLAKGATKAFVYDTYSDMISELNQLDKAELLVNYHIMIRTVCVPDLWISGVSNEHVEYTYASNEDFITDLTEDGVVQVGHFVLSALETQKVELDDYVKKDDYANSEQGGVIRLYQGTSMGLGITGSGYLYAVGASQSDIDTRTNANKGIPTTQLDYAVMKALSDSKLEWTEEQKQLARELLGSVGTSDYASAVKAGTLKTAYGYGTAMIGDTLYLYKALNADIDKRTSNYLPIVPSNIDYAVKKALSDCKLSGDDVWTEEEKAKALETLGGVPKFTDKATGQAYYLYGVNANGTLVQVGVSYNNTAQQNRVPQYGANGILFVGTPSEDSHATTKKYVDDGFVGKVTTETDIQQAYVKGADGSQKMVNVTNISQANTIVERDGSGNFYVSAPTLSSHVTTKKYVDDLVTSTKDSIALKDASTGQVYNVRINNGVLEMVLVDEEVE